MTLTVTLLAIVVGLLALLVVGLLRSHAEILRRLHELGIDLDRDEATHDLPMAAPTRDPRGLHPRRDTAPSGRPATDLVGMTPDGGASVLRVTDVAHDTLLAFLSTGCPGCGDLWDALLDDAELVLPPGLRLVIVTPDPADESPGEVARLAPAGVPVIMSSAAWKDHDVPGSPYVVHVDGPSGRVRGEGTGRSWQQIRRLLSQATGDVGYLEPVGPTSKARADRRRERDADRALLQAGIEPGDPRLYGGVETEPREPGGARP